jgi:hypothetical protein
MAALKDRHAFRLRVDPGEEDLGVTFVLRLRHLEKGASLGRIIPSDAVGIPVMADRHST